MGCTQTHLRDHFDYEDDVDKQYARSLELEPRGADSPPTPRNLSAQVSYLLRSSSLAPPPPSPNNIVAVVCLRAISLCTVTLLHAACPKALMTRAKSMRKIAGKRLQEMRKPSLTLQ